MYSIFFVLYVKYVYMVARKRETDVGWVHKMRYIKKKVQPRVLGACWKPWRAKRNVRSNTWVTTLGKGSVQIHQV